MCNTDASGALGTAAAEYASADDLTATGRSAAKPVANPDQPLPPAGAGTRTDTGAPLLLIHGLIGSFDNPLILHQLNGFDTAAPALLGYGIYRDTDPARITIQNQLAHIAACARERFGNRPFHLAGHGTGGVIACLLAHTWPQQVLSLVSIEGHFSVRGAVLESKIADMSTVQLHASLRAWLAAPERWLDEYGAGGTLEQRARLHQWFSRQPATTLQAMSRSLLATIASTSCISALQAVYARLPVALLAGARSYKDWDMPPWIEQLAEELTLIDNAGHLPMLDDSVQFGIVLRDIIERQLLRCT